MHEDHEEGFSSQSGGKAHRPIDEPPQEKIPKGGWLDRSLLGGGSAGLRYGGAVLAVALATLVDKADFLSGGFRIYLVFYPFIVAATLYGGLGPGLLAITLSCLAATFFWVEPIGQFAIAGRADMISMAIFIAGNLFFVALCEQLRRALRRAAQAEAYRKNAVKMAAQARTLKENEQRLALAQKAGQVGMFDWDLLSDKVIWTPELEELFDLPSGGFKQTYDGWAKRIHPEDKSRLTPFFTEWIQSAGGRDKQCWEYRIPDSTGALRWIEARGEMIRDAAGRPIRITGTNRDITDQRRLEGELLLRERELNEAQRMAHVGSWQWDPLTDTPTWSEELFHIFGCDPKQAPPRYGDNARLFTPESWARLDAAAQTALGAGTSYQLTLESIFPDGTSKWVTARGEAVRDAAGNVARLIGTVQDITESKQAEEALKASEAKFRIVADNTYDWEFWLSPSGEFLYTSPSCLRITGHTAEAFQADPELLFRIIHPDDQSSYLHHRSFVGRAKASGELEFRIIRPDGTQRWLAHGCQPVFSEEGRFLGTRGSSRDVTERKAADKALRQSEERLQLVLDISPDTVCFKDGEGRWLVANEALLRLYGLAGIDYQGKTGAELAKLAPFFRDSLLACEASDAVALQKRELIRVEERVPQQDGNTVVMEVYKRPIFHANGKPKAIVVWGRDVTERKKIEQKFKEANAAKEQFIAVLSHELRTPLTPVLAIVTALEEQSDLSAAMRNDMELVHRNVEMEAILIDDLLDMTRINTGKITIHPEAVDLQVCLQAALRNCKKEIEAKHLKLSLSSPAERHHVWADPARLQQVFWNLLSNAVKFTPKEGQISIRTINDNGHVKVEIADTGIGIPPEVLPKVFNAFEQGEKATTRFFGGLGLGLSIAQTLVELHHGRLTAASEGKGKGASFTVELDTVPSAPTPATPPPCTMRRAERLPKILLVDDHVDTLTTMAKLLRKLGHTVTTATCVREALDLAEKEHFDVLVSDLGLPDGSGLDIIRGIKKLYSLHAIALSGYGTEEDIRNSREAGFEEHMIKPISFDTLRETIQRLGSRVA